MNTWKGHTRSFVTDIDIFALCLDTQVKRDTQVFYVPIHQNGLCDLKEGRNCRFLNGSYLNGRIHGKGHESKVSFKVRKNVGYN